MVATHSVNDGSFRIAVGSLVTSCGAGVDLCTDQNLYTTAGVFDKRQLGIVVDTQERPDALGRTIVYARVLSSGGYSGWCVARFLRRLDHTVWS